RRSVFVVPWGDQTYIGTTDTDYDGPLDDPQCTPEDIEYLLRAINASVREEITVDDITGTWAGLRPLVKTATSGRTADLSRRHKVTVDDDGLVTVAGGKLTTYREMASHTVDAVLDALGGRVRAGVSKRCRTTRLPLRGATGFEQVRDAGSDAAGTSGLDDDAVVHLADRYGGEARTLIAMVESDPALGERLAAGHPYLRAEVVYAARYEMATSVDDVLTRRVPLRLRDAEAAVAVADEVARLVADALGRVDDEAAPGAEAFREMGRRAREAAALPVPAVPPTSAAS